jgi:hypothetical protein
MILSCALANYANQGQSRNAKMSREARGSRDLAAGGQHPPLTRLSSLAIVYRMPVQRRLRRGTT